MKKNTRIVNIREKTLDIGTVYISSALSGNYVNIDYDIYEKANFIMLPKSFCKKYLPRCSNIIVKIAEYINREQTKCIASFRAEDWFADNHVLLESQLYASRTPDTGLNDIVAIMKMLGLRE